MGLSGLEPPTSRLSGVRSNRLSYKPSYFSLKFGSHLLSHTVTSAVPSAAWVLTIVFGMGTGVTPKRIATEMFAYSSFAVHLKKIREKLVFLSTLFLMYQRDSRDRENFVLEVSQNALLTRTLIIKQQMQVFLTFLP